MTDQEAIKLFIEQLGTQKIGERHLVVIERAEEAGELARAIMRKAALQALTDQAQELDMGYGPNACPACGRSK